MWEAKVVPPYPTRDDLPTTWPHWLVAARNVLGQAVVKFFVPDATGGTSSEVLVIVASRRWPVERCFQDTKTELGLDHFEGRTYDVPVGHLAVTAVTFLFLSKVRLDRRGKKPGPVPPVPQRTPGAGGRPDRPRPGPKPAGRRLSPQGHARAA